VLVLKNRFRYTEQIAKEYTAIYDESRGIKRASFTTAVSLNETDKKNYTAQLEKIIGNKLHIDFEVDNNIIGGFIARIDGSLIDGSLRNRLDILRDQISKYGK
jgi:F-type H+-transporting ATPase subunit delta